MKKIILIAINVILLNVPMLRAQNDSIKEKIEEAVDLMDNNEIAQSKTILEDILKTYPDNYVANYEYAYADYLDKDYDDVVKICKKLESSKDVTDLTYQIEGNALDLSGDPKKAIKIYEKGLKLFPKSGNLCLERGMMFQRIKDYNDALYYYEKGINGTPAFPSNYYRATNIYLASTEPVWGLIYGEIMFNMQPESERAKIISKEMYDCYKENIHFKKPKSVGVTFTKENTINMDPKTKVMTLQFPTVFELALVDSIDQIINDSTFSISALSKIREGQVRFYFGMDKNGAAWNEKFKNVLFDYLKRLLAAGHFEAYNMYLFREGNLGEFNIWTGENEKEYLDFKRWYNDNPLIINENNYFSRDNNGIGKLNNPLPN